METVEVVLFLLVAVIVGGVVILFVVNLDTASTQRVVRGAFEGDELAPFQKVDAASLVPYLFRFWEACGHGTMGQNATMQYLGDPASALAISRGLQEQRLCGTLGLAACGCGVRDDVTFGGERVTNCSEEVFFTGSLYRVRCDPQNLTLDIDAS